MDKYIFNESIMAYGMNAGRLLYPLFDTFRRRNTAYWIMGQCHKQYLKEHKQFLYTTMLIDGTLNPCLADIDRQAQKRLLLLTKQIAEQENVTEQLKADNAMLWVQKMNEMQAGVREIIYIEFPYT